jgi:hypothetical protein
MEGVAARQVRERTVSPDAARPLSVKELTRDTASEARRAAAVAIFSRVALVAAALVTTLTLGVRTRDIVLRDPKHAEVLSGALKRLFEPWAHWDGVWYSRIAADGYRAHEFGPAFFSLYPSMGRALSSLPRFVLVDFPLFMGLAVILCQHRVLRWLVVAGLLVPLAVSTVYFTSWA